MTSQILVAQTAPAAAGTAQPPPAAGGPAPPQQPQVFDPFTLLMFGLPLFLLYFVMIRPAQRQEKQRKAMLATLKRGDEVVASGGILATVAGVKEKPGGIAGAEDEILLRIDDKTKMRVLRSSILRVQPAEAPAADKDKEAGGN